MISALITFYPFLMPKVVILWPPPCTFHGHIVSYPRRSFNRAKERGFCWMGGLWCRKHLFSPKEQKISLTQCFYLSTWWMSIHFPPNLFSYCHCIPNNIIILILTIKIPFTIQLKWALNKFEQRGIGRIRRSFHLLYNRNKENEMRRRRKMDTYGVE